MKRLFALILALLMLLGGCSSGVSQEEYDKLLAENEALKQQVGTAEEPELPEEEAPAETPEPTATPEPEALPGLKDAPVLTAQEVMTQADVCEFFLDSTAVTADVMPPQPASFYSHYQAARDKVYVDVCVGYKNLSTRERPADEILSATLLYGGKYQYTGFSVLEEDSRGDFTYTNITDLAPLTQEYLHYLFLLPAEAETSTAAMEVLLHVEGEPYRVTVREGSTEQVAAANEASVERREGEVAQGEWILLPDECEFFVDYSAIGARIDPPQPGDFYSYYEAENGAVYVDFCVGYRSWKNAGVRADELLSATLLYGGKYEYTGFSIIEEDARTDFTYSNITDVAPLGTEYLHYLFEVPAEVETSAEPIVITFTVGGCTYTYTAR